MKKYFFIVLTVVLFYYGCVDAVNSPTTSSTNTGDTQIPTITINYPATNDSLQVGSNEFLFVAKDDVGVGWVELWIDSSYTSLVKYDGTKANPSIIWTIDSTYLGKTIKYFLRVFDKTGKYTDSPMQTNILVAKLLFPPTAPTNLALLQLSQWMINISWKHDNQNVDGFRIYRKTGTAGIYTKLKDVEPNSSNTNDAGIDPSIIYFYKVVAYNGKGESASTNIVSTGGTGGTIAMPTNLSCVANGSRRIVITWQDNSNNENFFRIERRAFFSEYKSIGVVPANATTFNDSGYGLVPNTDYNYRIKAVSDNDSISSSEVNAKTYPYDLIVPLNLKAINHNSKTIRLVWTDNNTNETQTIIERRSTSSLTYSMVGSVGKDMTQFDDQDIVLGLTYYYRIRVSDYVNYSGYTNEISANAQPAFIISPSNLQGNYTVGNVIKLTWMNNSNNETNFSIERASDTALSNFTEIAVTDKDIAEYVDPSTVGGKTYAYRIRATDGVVYSGYSNVITIKNPSK